MSATQTVALRFQRSALREKADLSPAGLAALTIATHPARFIEGLAASGDARDAVVALAMMLPARQAVWWACLAARLLPDPSEADGAAIAAAERWVQGASVADAEQAGTIAQGGDLSRAPAWVAMAAFWAGPSLAPRGQQPVAPAPHLSGVATRTVLLLLGLEPALEGRVILADWLPIGLALMNGGDGREAQTALRERIAIA